MPSGQNGFVCCDRCAASVNGGRAGAAVDAVAARRRLLKAAVLRTQTEHGLAARAAPRSAAARLGVADPAASNGPADPRVARPPAAGSALPVPAPRSSAPGGHPSGGPAITGMVTHGWPTTGPAAGALADTAGRDVGFADAGQLPRTVSGVVQDVSAHVLVLGEGASEQRYALTPEAVAWRGSQFEPAALHQGDRVVVRLSPAGRHIADRIWANIGRVTGIITERSGDTLIVDEGATRKPQVVVLRPSVLGRIQVRFPDLEPGYLVDIIGLRGDGELIGMVPATSQPRYPVHRLPTPPLVSGRVPDSISGSATWHEPHNEPPGILGVDYPALDPETGCAEDVADRARRSYARMPYLAIGSVLRVRNDCTGADCLIPVTGCASISRLFNDRCVTCGTSPRGRIADLTLASFVALGGELERGCFNATITIGA
jgi:hypothetical protein